MQPLTRSASDTLWILYGPEPPMTYVIDAYAKADRSATLYWFQAPQGGARFGRTLRLVPGDERDGLTVNAINPSLLWHLIREPAATVVVQELNLIALFACLSRVVRRQRRVVAMVEGDIMQVGRTGSARMKVWLRRLLVRHVDSYAANNPDASRYLREVLRVPAARIHEGWWLSGMPGSLQPRPVDVPADGAVVIAVGRLVDLKGHDVLIRAAGRYQREVGPITVWIVGEGEARTQLRELAVTEGLDQRVHLLGQRTHEELLWALQHSDVMVFPTRQDLVGRAAVEALGTGTPVLASSKARALLHLIKDGRNGIVLDQITAEEVFHALTRALDPQVLPVLRDGAADTAMTLTPETGAAAIRRAIEIAHGRT